VGVPLFVYGTLIDPRVLRRVTQQAALTRRALPAAAMDWRLVVLRGTPYPTLVPLPGARTEGILLCPSWSVLARITTYEDPPYRLHPVAVIAPKGALRARAFIAPEWLADPARAWPEDEADD
jgi:gamma-glutamylcyclotransferase (GGCT)/AIG2-like uncharacterized protein YtfP